jgi:hypothetical protein
MDFVIVNNDDPDDDTIEITVDGNVRREVIGGRIRLGDEVLDLLRNWGDRMFGNNNKEKDDKAL